MENKNENRKKKKQERNIPAAIGCWVVLLGIIVCIAFFLFKECSDENSLLSNTSSHSSLPKENNSTVNRDVVISSSVTKNQVYIVLQDFIKDKLNHPTEAEFDRNIVYEIEASNRHIALGKVVAKNSFGIKTEYTYKIWLIYNGNDWTDKNSWTVEKIILENPNTGGQFSTDNRVKPQNNTTKRELSSIDGIKCTIIESNDSATRITTSKKMTESQFKKALSRWNLPTKIIYLHLSNKIERGQEYASKTGDLILFF
jgi:hypothetical protein